MKKFSCTFIYSETGTATATIEAANLKQAKIIAEAMTRDDPRLTETPIDGSLEFDDIEEQS